MADDVFNISRGAFAEKFRDAAANGIVLLMQANEAETTLVDREELAALFAEAGNTESLATDYARKTGLTGTVTVDHSNDRVDVDLPDQTWVGLGNGVNTPTTKLVVAYEEAAAEATRIPLSHHDFVVVPDNSDVTCQFNAAGFARAA